MRQPLDAGHSDENTRRITSADRDEQPEQAGTEEDRSQRQADDRVPCLVEMDQLDEINRERALQGFGHPH